MKISDYVGDYFAVIPADCEQPWEATSRSKEIVKKIIGTLDGSFTVDNGVAIHKDAVVEQYAVLKGPVIIGKGCFVGAFAYVRDGVFLGDDVTIGPYCEVKSSFIFGKTKIAHLNYIGDSIVGSEVNIEAGAVIANQLNEKEGAEKSVRVLVEGTAIDTGKQKFGAVVGDGSRIGANAVLNPGTILPPRSVVGRLEHVDQLNYERENRATYDTYASDYEEKTKDYTEKYIKEDFDLFLQNLKGKKILDLGSGPGRDSIRFKQKGLYPVCIDISKAMVNLCKDKGLEAYEMDIENLEFEDISFDGVWAYTSLLHLPKSKIKNVLKRIKEILKSNGIFYLGMKAGSFEGFEENKRYSNHKRYVSWYTKEELEKMLSEFFEILHFSKVEIDRGHIYINFLCKKKK